MEFVSFKKKAVEIIASSTVLRYLLVLLVSVQGTALRASDMFSIFVNPFFMNCVDTEVTAGITF